MIVAGGEGDVKESGKGKSPKTPNGNGARSFTFRELAAATRNFREMNLIGEGGFGRVYRGWLESGQIVAVKQLNHDGLQGFQEFIVEVLMLSLLHHPNLVTLIGYCTAGDQRLLVYEYMPMGSLENHLFELEPDQQPLSWSTRMKIAVGAARGLEYLHCVANPPVIYRDLKSANILLDNDFNPKLSDFGLAKLGPVGDNTHVSTRVMGTYGYCAPEYAMSGKLTLKSDIYSFGVVLLELITGRRAIDRSKKPGEQNLVVWSRPYLKDQKKFREMVDPQLHGRYPRHTPSKNNIKQDGSINREGHDSHRSAEKGKGVVERTDDGSDNNKETITPPTPQVITPNLKVFTLQDLKSATRNFRPDTMLGEGGFGRVFKGWIDEKTYAPTKVGSGIAVAVKKSNPDSSQGLEEWRCEVKFLGKFSHRNLVKLIGYCWEERQFLLVYEYMQKGSLEKHLFRKGGEPLSWETRLKIAIGAAQGLAFLHTSEKSVIYRDFKTSNILLDGAYNAKLSDFGLAKLGPENGFSHLTTRVMGTYGYAAPEYVSTGHLYVKSDVYGFGVVLLELLTGRKALDTNRPTGEHSLVDWAKPFMSEKKKLKKIVDPNIEDQYSIKGAMQLAALVLHCLEPDPKSRPCMEEVNEMKEKPKESKSSAKNRPNKGKEEPSSLNRSPLHSTRHSSKAAKPTARSLYE
ncbi:hypothetical protein Tsubulata_027974 [Turnera subulata]|uniref:non-specific serine/threonine protein kinase n=1 Tax=Turnera subulata TaxID=218843 RepID=A0A9Q0FBW6_9ROSI|nr:hypothetical protein Tsubulata_027974 [Turnera subulata]